MSEVSAITALARETQRKVGGVSDLTSDQIQDLKNEAIVHKAAYLTARAEGARRVLFVGNAYDPSVHRRLELSQADLDRFGCDAGFVGTYEEDRAQQMLRLARQGCPPASAGAAGAASVTGQPSSRTRWTRSRSNAGVSFALA